MSHDSAINVSGNQGDVIGLGIQGDANVIGKNISITGDIAVNNNNYNNLAPEFKNSLNELLVLLNKESGHLPKEQKKSFSEIIDKLAKEYQSIKPDEEIKDEDKKDDAKSKLIMLVEKLVDLMPDVAKSITLITPLAPFSKVIGKGTGYFGDLIKKKLINK